MEGGISGNIKRMLTTSHVSNRLRFPMSSGLAIAHLKFRALHVDFQLKCDFKVLCACNSWVEVFKVQRCIENHLSNKDDTGVSTCDGERSPLVLIIDCVLCQHYDRAFLHSTTNLYMRIDGVDDQFLLFFNSTWTCGLGLAMLCACFIIIHMVWVWTKNVCISLNPQGDDTWKREPCSTVGVGCASLITLSWFKESKIPSKSNLKYDVRKLLKLLTMLHISKTNMLSIVQESFLQTLDVA